MNDDYPEKLLRERRKQFLRDLAIQQHTGMTRTGCRNTLIVILLVILFLVFLYLYSQGTFSTVLRIFAG